jgi:hypothetical protein
MTTPAVAAALRTIRRSACYDLIVTAAFATPWTARGLAGALGALHDALGLPGERPALVGAVPVLLANLMGSLVVLWSILRIRAPTLDHGRTDTIARAVFALWMAWALVDGASPLIAGFLAAEIAWGAVQARAIRAARYAGA